MTAKTLSIILFDYWKQEKLAEGYHLPARCPVYERNSDNFDIQDNADIIHCSKCLASLVDYNDLTEAKKTELLNDADAFLAKYGN